MMTIKNAIRPVRKSLLQLARKGQRKTRIVGSPKTGYSLAVDKSDNACVIVSRPLPFKSNVIMLSVRKANQKPAVRVVTTFETN